MDRVEFLDFSLLTHDISRVDCYSTEQTVRPRSPSTRLYSGGVDTTVMPANSSVDLVWLFGPFVAYLVMLGVYYVWEGRREKRLRAQYEESEYAQ